MITHEVTLDWRDGPTRTIAVAPDETVVEAAQRTEQTLPYGCLYGACGTCTGRLIAGELVHTERARALKPRHSTEGYVLLCIAKPRSDCHVEVGATVQAELVSNPWK
ncbi:2Fe-2S iron-sulfur cluster-binding protein [Halococcus dombrowskii]|uniref:2Fe-2S iron-sulfur cluster-binding protein n=1 Tax=Halococcus dombrowskii TaxID=179637 RepID=A0AAV3SCU7_HALDO|nr:2Fe-2S iron-sulfur cluster-binding protein [Halococcus dombrowskii]UOO94388.1 2Fe-2S iron-sulfur cluster-binding protein [Halococcus dombrowskii]